MLLQSLFCHLDTVVHRSLNKLTVKLKLYSLQENVNIYVDLVFLKVEPKTTQFCCKMAKVGNTGLKAFWSHSKVCSSFINVK